MVAFPTHASLVQSAPVSVTAHLSVGSAHLATVVMGLPAQTLMNAKRSQMLAILTMEFIVVRTLSQDTTASPVLHVSLVPNLLEEVWKRQLLKSRCGLFVVTIHCSWALHMNSLHVLTLYNYFRCALPATLARMVATTAIKMRTAYIWASTPSQCSAVNASQDMLGMAGFAERTVTWMDGLTLICLVWRTPLITAKR